MIKIQFNNQPEELEKSMSLTAFVEQKGLCATNIAIAVNGSVVPKNKWSDTEISDGDNILIIKAFYGG